MSRITVADAPVPAGGSTPVSYLELGTGAAGITVTAGSDGNLFGMFGPGDRQVWVTSNVDGVSLPEGWAVTDSAGAFHALTVPKGLYAVYTFAGLSLSVNPTSGALFIGNMLGGAMSDGPLPSRRGAADLVANNRIEVAALAYVATDGGVLLQDFGGGSPPLHNSTDCDITVSGPWFDVYKIA